MVSLSDTGPCGGATKKALLAYKRVDRRSAMKPATSTSTFDRAKPAEPRRFVFVLLDNFTLLSFASALECLRIANRMLDEKVYSWMLIGRICCSRAPSP